MNGETWNGTDEQARRASILSDGIVRSTRDRGIERHSVQQLTNKQVMDLMSAKRAAIEQSRKDRKKPVYVDVDDEGEVSLSNKFTKDVTLHVYKNGSEIGLPAESAPPEPKQRSKGKPTPGYVRNSMNARKGNVTKQTSPDVNTETDMGKKKAKSTKKNGERAQVKVVGTKQTLTVKAMRAAIKAGKVVRNAKGFYFSEPFLAGKKDQEKKHEVFVK